MKVCPGNYCCNDNCCPWSGQSSSASWRHHVFRKEGFWIMQQKVHFFAEKTFFFSFVSEWQ
jgi:hypothetical protein